MYLQYCSGLHQMITLVNHIFLSTLHFVAVVATQSEIHFSICLSAVWTLTWMHGQAVISQCTPFHHKMLKTLEIYYLSILIAHSSQIWTTLISDKKAIVLSLKCQMTLHQVYNTKVLYITRWKVQCQTQKTHSYIK